MALKWAGKLPLNPRYRFLSNNFILCSEICRPHLYVEISLGKKSLPISSPKSIWILPPGTLWKFSSFTLSYPLIFLTASALSFISISNLSLSFFLIVAISSTIEAFIRIWRPFLLVNTRDMTAPSVVPPIPAILLSSSVLSNCILSFSESSLSISVVEEQLSKAANISCPLTSM